MPFRCVTLLLAALLTSACAEIHTTVLSQDSLAGRNNNTAGSTETQNYLIAVMQARGIAGLNSAASGSNAYKQTFTSGTNILGVIPGSDLANEYVIVGAHYDHISGCLDKSGAFDSICNGATDNAAGVGAALDIGTYFSEPGNEPRRTIVLAFWDREEDGLLGSAHYTGNALVPLAATVAYINFDILGSNLLPSLRGASLAVGAETGGAALIAGLQAAIATQPLDVKLFRSLFGQNRSDYINFINAGVPTVFFSDSTGPCYHTSGDDMSVVDVQKLLQQMQIALNLTQQLASGALTPVFTPSVPVAAYADAVALNDLLTLALSDLSRFSASNQALIQNRANALAQIVDGGELAFDGTDLATTLGAAGDLVSLLTTGECDGFLQE